MAELSELANSVPHHSRSGFSGRSVLVTGRTKGIGLATGLSFAKRGADVTITQKRGSAGERAVNAAFAAAGAAAPHIVEADASCEDDVRKVLCAIRQRHQQLGAQRTQVSAPRLLLRTEL